ncbi:MAG: DUF885 domain-containing protein [Nitriliruptoraceae bacterium]
MKTDGQPGTSATARPVPVVEAAQQVAWLVERYVDQLAEYAPVEATRIGVPGRDGLLPDLDPAALALRSRDLAVLTAEVDRLLRALGDDGDDEPIAVGEARDDLRLLAIELDYRRFILNERPRFIVDPLAVLDTIVSGLHELLHRSVRLPDGRREYLDAAIQRTRRVPVVLEQAGSLLESTPGPHLAHALQRLPSLIKLVRDELPKRAAGAGVELSIAQDAGDVAAEGLEAYGALLLELADEPAAPWRLGPKWHATVLRSGAGTAMSAADIHARARVWRDQMRDELDELASAGWQRRFPGERRPDSMTARIGRTLAAVADTAVTAGDFVTEARCAVDEARQFAIEAGLTDVPPAARLRVEQMPTYLRGLAVAFITPPAALRPDIGCTYYIAEAPTDWPADQLQAYLREYNPAQLRSLAIHEGYPGHFVQLEHSLAHPRLARRLLTKPVFAEGWAVYIEREALAQGFGRRTPSHVHPDDYAVTQRKLELRIATNAMLDVGLHAGDLDDPGAVELLINGAFQTPDEANAKLVRAKVTAGQLSTYFVGGEELTDLRLARQQADGPKFDLRRFHQQTLSHGIPTIDIVARAISRDGTARRPFAPIGTRTE